MDQKVVRHFKKVDPTLYKILVKLLQSNWKIDYQNVQSENYFQALCESIISQQLSVKAGDTIFNRFKKLFKKRSIDPKQVLQIKDEKIRACGLSNGKVKYIKDLAKKIAEGRVVLEKLKDLSNEGVIAELIKVKGIGKWTAEMFLMFSLGREDVFSHGDLGLKNAIKKIYNLDNPTVEKVEEIVIKWSPYKTYACRMLWRSLDNE